MFSGHCTSHFMVQRKIIDTNEDQCTQVEHSRQETAGSNEIPVISWQQYSHEWIRWPDLFGFCGNRQEPATTGNRIRSPVHCIGFLPFSDGIPAKYCTFPRGFHRKCMGILLPGNIDLGSFWAPSQYEYNIR